MEEVESIVLQPVEVMGINLIRITYRSCIAHVACGSDWATIYDINSSERGKGHCQELLKQAKEFYSQHGKVFGSTVALNDSMKHILNKLNIIEYK